MSPRPAEHSGDHDPPAAKDTADPGGHGRCLLWFLVLVLVTGAALDAAVGTRRPVPPEERRNPYFRRGWTEHTRSAKPKQPGEHLVVIISNSQGYARELADAHAYPSLLEAQLAGRLHQPVRVLNWSIPAGVGPEFVLLGAAAAGLEPDVLLLIAGPGNFETPWLRIDTGVPRPFGWPSDCRYLLGYGEVRRRIPASFRAQYVRPIDGVDIALGRVASPWRIRGLPAAWFAQFAPLRPFLRAPEEETWFYDPIRPPAAPNRTFPPVAIDRQLLHDYLTATSGLPRTRRLLVAMPVHSRRRGRAPDFPANLRPAWTAAGADVWDCRAILADDQFIFTTHATRDGHRVFADHLAERLAP